MKPAAAAVLLVLAGCGTQPLTTEELRARASRVCADAQRELRGVRRVQAGDAAAAREALGRTTGITRRAVRRLAELEPPESLEDRYERFVTGLERQQELAERLAQRLARGEPVRGDVVAKGRELAAGTDRLADDLGIRSCGAPA